MEKNEILEKSRKEKQDEGVKYAMMTSGNASYAAGLVVCALFFILSVVFGNELISISGWLMLCVMTAAQQFTLFKNLHKRFYLIMGIVHTVVSVAFAVKLILELKGF